jgi:hypothetical protein
MVLTIVSPLRSWLPIERENPDAISEVAPKILSRRLARHDAITSHWLQLHLEAQTFYPSDGAPNRGRLMAFIEVVLPQLSELPSIS